MTKKHSSSAALRDSHYKKLKKIRILVVNESANAGDLIKRMFEALGFGHVIAVTNGMDAMQVMREMRVDMVLVDSMLSIQPKEWEGCPSMNRMEGAEFIHRLRHAPGSPNRFMPTLMLVGGLNGQEAMRARDAGVNEMVMKPLSGENFSQRMIQLFDTPKHFITAETYKGPCRRSRKGKPRELTQERRRRDVRVVRYEEMAG